MSSPEELRKVTTNRELRQRRWLKRIERLVPQMLEKADQEGGIVVANLGQKHLPDGRVVAFMLAARVVYKDS
ncbi:MAG TPA: hypothetical protein VKB53_01775, partial [Gammaproteobacteria bacterium]|nr:hypothetical protein [Gammaproteobacteria bacterium]